MSRDNEEPVATPEAAGGQERPGKPRMRWTAPASAVLAVAITWWSVSEDYGVGLSIGEIAANFTRAKPIIQEFLDPRWSYWPAIVGPFLETVRMAIVAAIIGCGIALVAAFLASKVTSPNTATYLADKGVLSVLRSIPDVLYALVFVAAVGIGPLAGIMAMVFFNIGIVAKLLSETVDAVDLGPIEAARATGGSRFAAIRTAVFPQVLPNYLAYSLYVFELNLRASAVIGIVGAGGIGQLINIERTAFRYDRLAVIIVAIFVIVFVVESVSIAVRRRLV